MSSTLQHVHGTLLQLFMILYLLRRNLYFIVPIFVNMEKMVISNDILFEEVLRVLATGRNVQIPVKGVSMLPLIKGERDTVVLEPLSPGSRNEGRQPEAGDIVLFRVGGRFILHRILSLKDGIATIQGDGVPKNQERCRIEHIYGRVVTIIKPGGRKVDPNTPFRLRLARIWHLMPLKRYILAIYRRLPWNYWIQKGLK